MHEALILTFKEHPFFRVYSSIFAPAKRKHLKLHNLNISEGFSECHCYSPRADFVLSAF